MNTVEYDEIMKQWDIIRALIANGDKTSYPRDWFESVIDSFIENEKQISR